MKNQKFNAKEFLNLKTLSPLEETVIKGGNMDTVIKAKQKQKS